MTDDRLGVLLPRLERPARPDQAFADRLFEELVVEAGFRGPRPRSWRNAIAWPRVGGQTSVRLAWIAVLLALLLAIAGLVAGIGRERPTVEVVPSPTTVAGPPGPRIGSGVLEVGSVAPTWSGRLLDGRPFSTDDLRGKPAALLLWCTCSPGPQPRWFLEAARSRADEIGLVLVSMDTIGTTQGLADSLGLGTPIVHDEGMDLLSSWQLEGFPALVLLRGDGTVADLHPATFSEEKLGAILDALAAGEPIPDPDPIEPPLLDEQGRNLSTDVLQVGVVPPELDGSGLDGEPLSTADLRGRPSVVLFWLPPRADGTTQDDVQPPNLLLDEIERRGDAIGALLVALGEPAPGDARRYLERGGYDVPVILDWTGELQDRWGLVFMTTLVLLDAHGRVVGYYGPDALGDPAGVLDTVAPTAS